MDMVGEVAVVTGAAGGLGFVIARELAKAGAAVVLNDVRPPQLRAAVRELSEQGLNVEGHVADVTSELEIEDLSSAAEARFGPVSMWVNNAGFGLTRLVLETTFAEWSRTLEVNLTATFIGCQIAARSMLRNRTKGRILNISSISAQRGGSGRGAYGASKAGVELLTKTLALELGYAGIRVNAIAPGPIETDMALAMHDAETKVAYETAIPLGRYGQPIDIANAAKFLLHRSNSWISGQIVNIDGGFTSAGLVLPKYMEKNRKEYA